MIVKDMREPPPGTVMTQWVIYDHPKDFPNGFVLRAWFIAEGGALFMDEIAWYADDIEKLRGIVPSGFVCVHRDPQDDPAIAEVWI